MMLFQAALLLAAVLCSLVAGFLIAFAAVVMPGFRNLDDPAFLRAFQVVDGVIQRGQPLFIFVWIGSVLAVVAAAVLGMLALTGAERLLIVLAALLYLFGVQLPTVMVNVPLNNQLQSLDVATMSETARQGARAAFEARWNRWNVIRTVCAGLVAVLLLLVLLGV